MADEVTFKDFTKRRPRIFLRLDGEEYEGKSALGLPTLQAVQRIQKKLSDPQTDKIDIFRDMFAALLKKESAQRFMVKLEDEDEPVDPDQLQGMVAYLMERHALRPTEGPSESPSGSETVEPGTPSTDGASQPG